MINATLHTDRLHTKPSAFCYIYINAFAELRKQNALHASHVVV